MVQLGEARLALPKEDLIKEMVADDNATYTIEQECHEIPLNDPRVLKIYNNKLASKQMSANSKEDHTEMNSF